MMGYSTLPTCICKYCHNYPLPTSVLVGAWCRAMRSRVFPKYGVTQRKVLQHKKTKIQIFLLIHNEYLVGTHKVSLEKV